ncbi:DUF4870 domain-containing protein [Paenibacillus piri]|uniref:DUF4870 domain-containing protein n=1 Tax=Paenibacillus piri TaxID=2547395 RepID=A0A4R5KEZ0_9BACL|nr:DUF4870 domain-containing protein [Paenibacillus piri]TDF93843.1 DUF4870 domain-containing protein [Paenibacillus piri]
MSSEDKTLALLSHILSLFVGFIAPLVIWLIKKDQSQYVAEQAKESLNFQISLLIYYFVAWILTFLVIGLILLPALWVFSVIVVILAAVKANSGEMYRYPLTIRFVK